MAGHWVKEEEKGKARQNSNAKKMYNLSYTAILLVK